MSTGYHPVRPKMNPMMDCGQCGRQQSIIWPGDWLCWPWSALRTHHVDLLATICFGGSWSQDTTPRSQGWVTWSILTSAVSNILSFGWSLIVMGAIPRSQGWVERCITTRTVDNDPPFDPVTDYASHDLVFGLIVRPGCPRTASVVIMSTRCHPGHQGWVL